MPDFHHSIPAIREATRESARAPTLEDFIVPALQTAFGGAVFGLAGACAWLAFGGHLLGAVKFGLASGGAALVVAYTTLFIIYWPGLNVLTTVETIIGADLNQDGRVGPMPYVQVEIKRDGGFDFPRLPGSSEAIRQFAAGVTHGLPASGRQWYEVFGRDDSGRDIWLLFRDAAIGGGLLEWKNPNNPQSSLRLTDVGRAVFRQLATADEQLLLESDST